jgi:26S proteasome regulatory subunit N1
MESAKKNLATTLVNSLINAGFSSDNLMTTEGDKWVYKNKENGMLSASASLGLIYLWDYEEGLTVIDRFLYSDNYIKAGSLLAQGILNSGLRNGVVKHLEIMQNLESGDLNCRICSIIG